MKTKASIIAVLLFAVACFAGFSTSCAEGPAKEKASDSKTDTISVVKDSTAKEDAGSAEVIAYYFYGNRRCVTCKKIESYTTEAIETGFADQLKSGILQWRPVNLDEEGNDHFRVDYNIYTKQVILSKVENGKETTWKDLDKIWKLVRGDKEKYVKYIQDEITAFLGES